MSGTGLITCTDRHDDEPVMVRVASILCLFPAERPTRGTKIHLLTNMYLYVRETPGEVAAKIAKAAQ